MDLDDKPRRLYKVWKGSNAKEYLDLPEVMSYVVDPELKHFRFEDLKVVCEVVNLCINPDSSKQLSMKELCTMLESGIDFDTSISVDFGMG